jgi:hypothetical protein
VEGDQRAKDRRWILHLRVVAHLREVDDVGSRNQLAVARREVSARHGIERAIDEPQRNLRLREDPDPASAVTPALGHVADEPMKDAVAIRVSEEGPELVDERHARWRVGSEDGRHASPERALAGARPSRRQCSNAAR